MRTQNKRFAETGEMVKAILENQPKTRDSYMELLIAVGRKFGLTDFFMDTALRAWEDKNLPSFASIMRARRKITEKYPHLAPSESVKERNAELADEYKEYYKK